MKLNNSNWFLITIILFFFCISCINKSNQFQVFGISSNEMLENYENYLSLIFCHSIRNLVCNSTEKAYDKLPTSFLKVKVALFAFNTQLAIFEVTKY